MVPVKTLLDLVSKGIAAATVTIVDARHLRSFPEPDRGAPGGTRSAIIGSALLVDEDGQIHFSDLPEHLVERSLEMGALAIENGKPYDAWFPPVQTAGSQEREGEEALQFRLFADPYLPNPRLVIAGAGHVGQALAELAAFLDYGITVIDDRPSYANRARFSNADEVICERFEKAFDRVRIDRSTAVVIVTRGHKHDYECLCQLVGRNAGYFGMIGSRRRVAMVKSMLLAEGVPGDFVDGLHAPIGLDIGAATPAEIGLSIIAEIVMERNRRTGGRLS